MPRSAWIKSSYLCFPQWLGQLACITMPTFSVKSGLTNIFPGIAIPQISASHAPGMTGLHYCVQLLIEIGFHKIFVQAGF
jgi:hypothetical protein